MSALPRPDLPPGPHRDLVDSLHELHHQAGWPSLRTLARETGVSHTTVSKTFSAPALPSWGTLELLVEAMGGVATEFHDLWLAATSPTNGTGLTAPRIAGRKAEVVAVRRHLESGTGLLLVTGEAGIGKTKLVTTAAESAATFVATGHCLPLSTQVPLMPISDALRSVLEHDRGEWFAAALAACPPFVAPSLATLLPEVAASAPPTAGQGTDRRRFFGAVTALLDELATIRSWALLVEDLPWADSVTLDLLEVLSTRPRTPPIVATWRTEDPDTDHAHVAWLSRATRGATSLHLGALTLPETREQLRLLGVCDEARAETIHLRSRGQPLFTEQLAAATSDDTLPRELQAFLTTRMAMLDDDAWRVARALGVADRALTAAQLASVAGVHGDLTRALRTLDCHRLLADDRELVRLRHPLVAESIRFRLVPGEGTEAHRQVALLLAGLPDPPASEIADHWDSAGDPGEELVWRTRAAQSAETRFARGEAYPEWQRVLELLSAPGARADGLDVTLTEVHIRTIETSISAHADVDVVRRHVEAAMAADLPEQGHAEVLLRAGDLECAIGDEDTGLRFIDEAIAINDRFAPTSGAGHILEVRALILASLGRHADVRASVDRGLAIADAVKDVGLRRRMLALKAWWLAGQGRGGEAEALAAGARQLVTAAADPICALHVAALETEILLMTGATRDAMVAATEDALIEADRWQVSTLDTDSILANLTFAHLHAGDVVAAAALVEPRVAGLSNTYMRNTQEAHCAVLLRQGHLERASGRLTELRAANFNYNAGSAYKDMLQADVDLWVGRPETARELTLRAAGFLLSGGYAGTSSGVLALHARAEADLVEVQSVSTDRSTALRRALDLRASGSTDPLGPDAHGADLAPNKLLWVAELARLDDAETIDLWVRAATAWDAVSRPHDAAYCRWRGAQVALREGKGVTAAKLLKRAANDSREHVPLNRAIAKTAEGLR